MPRFNFEGTHAAFTLKPPGPPRELITPVKIRVPSIYGGVSHEWLSTTALWDTGATNSVVNKVLATQLKLVAITRATTIGIHGPQDVDVFIIDIQLMDSVRFPAWRVSSGETGAPPPAPTPPGIIIGMDIIGKGDMTLMSGADGYYFSFIIPSTKSPIDWPAELKREDEEKKFKEQNKQSRAAYNAGKKGGKRHR